MRILTDNENEPKITLFIFSYNQEKYIEQACLSAFEQNYSNLEIIISDDCSNDKTFEIIQRLANEYKGDHELKINRNENNLGLINHVNYAFKISEGDLIVAAAGDDYSAPGRVSEIVKCYITSKKESLAFHSSVNALDHADKLLSIYEPPVVIKNMGLFKAASSNALYIGASGAWSKRLFDIFGEIKYTNTYEDLVLGFRAKLFDKLFYINKPLVNYRTNIGISSHYHRISKSKYIARKTKNIIYINVLKQRYLDLCKVNIKYKLILKIYILMTIFVTLIKIKYLTLINWVFSKN